MSTESQELAVREAQAAGVPVPVHRGQQMVTALRAYKELQAQLDEAMPDQVIRLGKKDFRKKGYWRAIAMAFDLSVKPITREQDERSVVGQLADGSDNYVYTVTYVASTPNGRSVTGDGTCAAAEKSTGRMEATEHNVRSHAHTRAYNRAVSNLVGFGEVSAEEATHDEDHRETRSASASASAPAATGTAKPNGLHVTNVTSRDGKNSRGPYTNYTVTFSDGVRASSFSDTVGKIARESKETGRIVVATFETTKKDDKEFHNIKTLAFADAPSESRQAQMEQNPMFAPDNEPKGQPEKVLSITPRMSIERKAGPDDKPAFWEVQSDRRDYVTNVPEHREMLEGARVLKASVIITFTRKPITANDTRSINRIDKVEDVPADGAVKVGEVVSDEMFA